MAVKRVILQHFSMKYDYMTKERPNIYQPSRAANNDSSNAFANSNVTIKQHLKAAAEDQKLQLLQMQQQQQQQRDEEAAALALAATTTTVPAPASDANDDNNGKQIDESNSNTKNAFEDDDGNEDDDEEEEEEEEDYDVATAARQVMQEMLLCSGHQRWDEFDDDDEDDDDYYHQYKNGEVVTNSSNSIGNGREDADDVDDGIAVSVDAAITAQLVGPSSNGVGIGGAVISANNSYSSSGMGSEPGDEAYDDDNDDDEDEKTMTGAMPVPTVLKGRRAPRRRCADNWSSDSMTQPADNGGGEEGGEEQDDEDIDGDEEIRRRRPPTSYLQQRSASSSSNNINNSCINNNHLQQQQPDTQAHVSTSSSSAAGAAVLSPLDSINELKEKLPDTYSRTNNMYKNDNNIINNRSNSGVKSEQQQQPMRIRSSPSIFKVPLRPTTSSSATSAAAAAAPIENWRYRSSTNNTHNPDAGNKQPQQQPAYRSISNAYAPINRANRYYGHNDSHSSMSGAAATAYGNNQLATQTPPQRYISFAESRASNNSSNSNGSTMSRLNWRNECANNASSSHQIVRNCGLQQQQQQRFGNCRSLIGGGSVNFNVGLSPPSESLLMQRRQRLNSRSSTDGSGGVAAAPAAAVISAIASG